MKSTVIALWSLLATVDAYGLNQRNFRASGVTGGTASPSNSTVLTTLTTCPVTATGKHGSVTAYNTTSTVVQTVCPTCPIPTGTSGPHTSKPFFPPLYPNSTVIRPTGTGSTKKEIVSSTFCPSTVITKSNGELTTIPITSKVQTSFFTKETVVPVESASVIIKEQKESEVIIDEQKETFEKTVTKETFTEQEKEKIVEQSVQQFGEIKSGEVSVSTIVGASPSVSTFISTPTGKVAVSQGEVFVEVKNSASPAAETFVSTPSGAVSITQGSAGAPGAPGAVSQLGQPGVPGAVSQPGQPGQPGAPGTASQPGQPGAPGAASQPGQPGVPGAASQPGQPGAPSDVSQPGAPAGSEQPLAFTGSASKAMANTASAVIAAAAAAFFL